VIVLPLKGKDGCGPVITDRECSNCGRCIDVCSKDVFAFGTRFGNKVAKVSQPAREMTPAACK
jgi:ferredoxin-type protein NapH